MSSRAENDLPATGATYLGGAGNDETTAADVAPDGSLLMAGTFPGYAPAGIPVVNLLGGGNGAVLHLDSSGQKLIGLTRIGSQVNDLQVNAQGLVVACGSFGVAVLLPPYQSIQWHANPGVGTRCSIGSDGTVAVKVGNRAYTYTKAGDPIQNWEVGGNTDRNYTDILIDSANQLVFVSGFRQDDGQTGCTPLQIAFLRAHRFDGILVWKRFDWSKAQVGAQKLCADTRGDRLGLGLDGKLYFAGRSAGGNTIFQRDPADITRTLTTQQLIKTDVYNNPYNISGNYITWYGRFDPTTGNLEKSQFLLTRLSSGKGNSATPNSISADETGQVYLVGTAACCLPTRNLTIGKSPVGAYGGYEAFLLIVTPDFSKRLLWTPFTLNGHGSGGAGLGVRNGRVVVSANMSNGQMVTVAPLQPVPATLPDTYLITWLAFHQ